MLRARRFEPDKRKNYTKRYRIEVSAVRSHGLLSLDYASILIRQARQLLIISNHLCIRESEERKESAAYP
jgi:hypothetical protein